MQMADQRVMQSFSNEKRQSLGGTVDPEKLVILRRKGSIDPSTELRQSDVSSDKYCDRGSIVNSVACDVMSGEPIRMMGYMEKRSKLLGWKKYWFVLDGHLLTYFKSRADYESLSPFVGSITLGNVSTVRPIQIKHSKGFPMQIVSRNQVYSLRCSEKSVLEEWVLALQETISIPPSISSPVWADPGAQFYRYSFASVSDWSIADSQGDISGSLSNLPKNFYLKRDKAEQFLLKQKCQSIANLPMDSTFQPPDSPHTSTRSNQSAKSLRQDPKMRYSTSLLQLESSAQAGELKRELASKLSIGHISPSAIRGGSGNELLEKLKIKFCEDKTPKTVSSFSSLSTCGDLSQIQDDDQTGKIQQLCSNSAKDNMYSNLNAAEAQRSSNSLASIAEGFEPNLKPRPQTLQVHSTYESEDTKSMKKKRGIGNLFQKIFKKEQDLSPTSIKRKNERAMVISGPVDLRARERGIQPYTLPKQPTATTHSPSSPNFTPYYQSKPPVDTSPTFLNELKTVQRRRSSISEESVSAETGIPPPPPPKTDNENMSYNEKLAKFNRISAQLNSSATSNSNACVGNGISRSSSCRVKSAQDDEEPPVLPPKKGTLGRENPLSSYDTPKNNRPITLTPTDTPEEKLTFVPEVLVARERKISLRCLLSKKNSAPEISTGGDGSHNTINSESFESANNPAQLDKASETACQSEQHSEGIHPPGSCDSEIDNVIDSNVSGEIESENSEELEPIYSAVPTEQFVEAIYEEIKYATQNTILNELETVQEYGDEEDEFFDELLPMTKYTSNTEEADSSCFPTHNHDYSSVRFSGMSALQQYLEENESNDASLAVIRGETGEAAVNRLGRSLAVHKLERLLE